MAGLKIKSSGEIALVDRSGNYSGVDIAEGLGHSKRSSGHDIKISHFYAGYGSTTSGAQGYGDGYKIWSGVAQREDVPFIGGNNPTGLAALDELAEIKFSDFYNARQQDTCISAKVAEFGAGSVTMTPYFGYSENMYWYGNSQRNETVGEAAPGHYHFQFNETMCGISTNTAGWKITGFHVQRTHLTGSTYQFTTRLLMAWSEGNSTPTRSNSGWTTCDVGKWDETSYESGGLPQVVDSMQISRTACTFIANYDTGQSYWRDQRNSTIASDTTIYKYSLTNDGENHVIMLNQ